MFGPVLVNIGICDLVFIDRFCEELIDNGELTIPKICDALRDLVLFVQFKKREKHPWRSVILVKLQAEALITI